MKSFFLPLFTLICIATSAQNKECKTWIGDPSDSLTVIQNITQKYLQTDLKIAGNPDAKTIFEMKDNLELSNLKVWMKPRKGVANGGVSTSYTISSIKITGVAEKINSLYVALKEKVAHCSTETAPATVVFGTTKIFVENKGASQWKNLPIATLTITSTN